jgi:hypothetical protein
MPIEFGLWRLDSGAVEAVPPAQLQDEAQLESVIEQRVDILGLGQLLILGRQVVTDYGKKIDLLAMDGQGDLYLIELKGDRTPRDVVAQALEYGWWVEPLSWDRISAIYAKHHDEADLATAFNEHFDGEIPETVNNAHHLVVVASRMDTSTEQIVEYVRRYGVPINVLFFQYLEDGERRYLARSWLRGPDEEVVSSRTSKKQPAWNGLDFFVAVGENQHRNWDDMQRFGFVSAGHGDKYRKAMSNLFEGARVWACIPGSGYVGVGEVTQAVGVRDFYLENEHGPTPILDVPGLAAPTMAEEADDPENAEYLVRVNWLDTRPREQAIWEKGMFANQNVVAKLRQPFTLRRLAEIFDVEGAEAEPIAERRAD